MSNPFSLRVPIPYVLTYEGHEATRQQGRCACVPTIDGGLVICPQCGTCWGNLADIQVGWSAPPKRGRE